MREELSVGWNRDAVVEFDNRVTGDSAIARLETFDRSHHLYELLKLLLLLRVSLLLLVQLD